jgi:GDP-L-fucose synthase
MDKSASIFIAGSRGLVGSAIVRSLRSAGYENLLLPAREALDLRSQPAVDEFFRTQHPEYVFFAAAKVGGILANSSFPAEFLYDNLAIQGNIIDSAWRHGVKKLQFLGSSCIYPKLAPQPIREEYLLTGPLEPTNEWYAIAKIAGIKMCQAYRKQHGFNAISLMPTNLYGPGDHFDLQNSHVLPALLRKFVEATESGAPEVSIWGSGSPRREFLHVDDLANAALFLMLNYDAPEIINVGTGEDVTIRELAETIGRLTGFSGRLVFDASKPDGTMRKLLDVSKLHRLGWKAKIPLERGLAETYRWYLEQRRMTAPVE